MRNAEEPDAHIVIPVMAQIFYKIKFICEFTAGEDTDFQLIITMSGNKLQNDVANKVGYLFLLAFYTDDIIFNER